MTARRLTSSTIIPQNLYVQRDADRQIAAIIRDMGRPGYVLVARQMGKTNLLLNSKRNLENARNCFTYVDLSRSYEDERECFRDIVDTIIDSHENLSHLKDVVQSSRNGETAPYREYESELRTILKFVEEKVVIILDEIDSLTNAKYSDRIFAQIRRLYFARDNVPEFKRLTYILSGVVEPTEIIKDKKISPFNIGEKIYLDDFSEDEIGQFIEKAGIRFSSETLSRVKYWTGGHPRLLWDVCSYLEELMEQKKELLPDDVDLAVRNLYLGDLSRPPVDHIRELVAEDKSIRDAIEVIRQNQGAELDDSTVTRLYLAGITASKQRASKPTIKNAIISASLSEKWLNDIVIKHRGYLEHANELMGNGRYSDALAAFKSFLLQQPFEPALAHAYYRDMAICYSHVGEYEQAIDMLTELGPKKSDGYTLYFDSLLTKAACYLKLGDLDPALEIYSEIIAERTNDFPYVAALLNMGGEYARRDTGEERGRAKGYLTDALEVIGDASAKVGTDQRRNLAMVAHFHLGRVFAKEEQREASVVEFNAALQNANERESIPILLELSGVSSAIQRGEIVGRAAEIIVKNELKLSVRLGLVMDLAYGQAHVPEIVRTLFSFDQNKCLIFVDYVKSYAGYENNAGLVYFEAALGNLGDRENCVRLLEESRNHGLKDASDRLALAMLLLLSESPGRGLFEEYENAFFEITSGKFISLVDFQTLIQVLQRHQGNRSFANILKISAHARELQSDVEATLSSNYAAIFFFEMVALSSLGERARLKNTALQTLEFLKKTSYDRTRSSLSIADFESIESAALRFVQQEEAPLPRKKILRYPRNSKVSVKYQDGTVITDKYKRLELDIQNGLCSVVPTLP